MVCVRVGELEDRRRNEFGHNEADLFRVSKNEFPAEKRSPSPSQIPPEALPALPKHAPPELAPPAARGIPSAVVCGCGGPFGRCGGGRGVRILKLIAIVTLSPSRFWTLRGSDSGPVRKILWSKVRWVLDYVNLY